MPDTIQSPAAMDAWMHMLDQVQESLDRALREAEDHERSLADGAGGGDWAEAERRGLELIDERLRGLEGHLEAAGRVAAEVEGLLADDERAVQAWADQAAAARRRLAGAGARGVS
jgi:hypothetical protein